MMKPIAKIVLTNRDHVRDTERFRARCGARLVAGADEVTQLAPTAIDKSLYNCTGSGILHVYGNGEVRGW